MRNAVKAPDVRLHDLRHFTATQLIAANVDIRTVAGRLGHSDPSMTLSVEEAAEALGLWLARRLSLS